MSPIKQHAHALIDALPDDTGWDEVIRTLDAAGFRHSVQQGIEAADRGDIASPAMVKAMFAKWGVDVAG